VGSVMSHERRGEYQSAQQTRKNGETTKRMALFHWVCLCRPPNNRFEGQHMCGFSQKNEPRRELRMGLTSRA